MIAEAHRAARTGDFHEPDGLALASASVLYAEQAARLLDRNAADLSPGALAAAWTAHAQARALASTAESLTRIDGQGGG